MLEARIDGAKHEVLAAVRGELVAAVPTQTCSMILAMVGSVTAVGGLAVASTRLG